MTEVFNNTGSLTIVLAFAVPIVAIIGGCITGIVKMLIKHRERVKMIESGIHPDYPPDEDEEDI